MRIPKWAIVCVAISVATSLCAWLYFSVTANQVVAAVALLYITKLVLEGTGPAQAEDNEDLSSPVLIAGRSRLGERKRTQQEALRRSRRVSSDESMPREAQSKRSTIDQFMADASREAYYTQQVLDAQYQDQQHHHHHDHAVVNA